MTDQAPIILDTVAPNDLRRIQTGDRLAPSSLGLTGDPLGTTDTQTATNKTLTSPKVNKLFASNDATDAVIDLTGVALAVNRLVVQNNVAGQAPRISAVGTDANIDIVLNPKGIGVVKGRYAGVTHELATLDTAQVLSLKALVAPNITDFTAMNHTHASAAQGGLLTKASFAPGAGVGRVVLQNIVDSAAIANTVTPTAFDNSQLATTLNAWAALGQVLRFTYTGRYSVTGTPTLLFRLRGSVGPTNLASQGPITSLVGVTNELWWVQFVLVVRAVGAGGSLYLTAPAATLGASTTGNRAIAQTTAFDFVANGTTATNLELTATWSAASALNTIVCEGVTVEALN